MVSETLSSAFTPLAYPHLKECTGRLEKERSGASSGIGQKESQVYAWFQWG
jgi:hypothetical protein